MTAAQGQPPLPTGGGMGGGLVPGIYSPPEAMRPTVVGDRWAVVAGHPLVSQIAADVLSRGGNAIDAGVAAGIASNVVQVDMANFGGIAPILVRVAGRDVAQSVAGVGRWGMAADREGLQARYGGGLPLGGVPCIVPGAPSAWITALARFGTWSFSEVAAPAAELALGGFPLDLRTAESLRLMGTGFARWPTTREIYWPSGRAPGFGERLVQADLGRLLGILAAAEQGDTRLERLNAVHNAFYRGPIAAQIVSFVQSAGGYLAEPDLASFQAQVAQAPSVSYRDWRVFVPPTWSQGLITAQALGILRGIPLAQLGHNSPDYLHHVIEALKLAFADREQYYGDPDFTRLDPEELVSERYLATLRARIGRRALGKLAAADESASPLRSTTAVAVVDAHGNAFCTAPSDTLDGAPIISGLGISCSPRGVQSRLAAGHPNALAPGKRPCVTPAALIALGGEGNSETWAMACPGGDVIVQALTQVFLNMTEFGMTAQQAVEAPRIAGFSFPSAFHPHPGADRLVFVEDRIGPEVRDELERRGHDIHLWPPYEFDAGSVQHCRAAAPGSEQCLITAGADPRRSAYAIAR